MIEHALAVLGRGWAVFPCKPRSKKPATPNGVNDATRDETQVRKWWSENPEFNPAISLRLSGLTVLDADTGLNTQEEAFAWAKRNELPATYTVRTGRRESFGIQFYYSGISKNKPYKHDGVSGEIRSAGYYVMAAGARHDVSGELYETLNAGEAVQVPLLVSTLSGTKAPGSVPTVYPPLSVERVHEIYQSHLQKTRNSGQGGRHYTSYAAAWFAARAFLAGVLAEEDTKRELWAATANHGLTDGKRLDNVRGGWDDGLRFGALKLTLYPADLFFLEMVNGDDRFQRCWDGDTGDFDTPLKAREYMVRTLTDLGSPNAERIVDASRIQEAIERAIRFELGLI